MSRETARGRITVRRRAKDGNDGSPGKDGAYTAFIYKRSEDTPATPTGQVIPPTGWSLSPDIGVEEIEFDSLDPFFSGIWSRTGNILSIVEGDVDHGETLVERISFTTTAADTTITVLLTVNSEASYDWLLLGDIDSSVSRSLYNSRLSGANKTLTVDLYIAEAGDHSFEIAFSKDSTRTQTGEMASVEIVKVVGQAAGTIWFSQAFVDNGVVGTWSAPAPMQGARGEAGQKGAIVRTLVWKEGMEYRNDVIGDTIAPDGNRYIDVCTNKDIALLNDPSLVVMVCQKTHTASTSIPFASGTYWQGVNQMQPMITALILAQTINATFIDVESIAAKTAFVEALSASTAFIKSLFAKEITASNMTLTEDCEIQGKVSIADEKILLDKDGSGHLASGAITWDEEGNGEISGAWLNPIGEATDALNKTIQISSSITVYRSISVGSYSSSSVSASSPIKRLGTVTIISTNTSSPSFVYMSGAKVVMPRITESYKAVDALMSTYNYLVLAPGSSVTFDVYDDYNLGARCLRSKSPLGWFNRNGSIYPYTYEGASYEDLAAITIYSNAIGSSMSGGSPASVISLPEGLVKYMKLKVSGSLTTSNDSNIFFLRSDEGATSSTAYTVEKLKSETDIVSSGSWINYRDGGKFGFGHTWSATITISYSPILYVKLYDSGSMIAYFEITL